MQPVLSDTKEIIGYGHWLVMRSQHAGNLRFDNHTASPEERAIARDMQMITGLITARLSECNPEDVGALLDCYDLTYRLGYSREPSFDFVDSHRRRLFQTWQQGAREIEESSVYHMLSPHMIRDCSPKDKARYAAARLALRDKWLETLRIHSFFPDATACENYQRLALIMREDIAAGLGCDAIRARRIKREWYEHNRVDDLSTLATHILPVYRRFITSLFPDVLTRKARLTLDNHILSRLTARPDLDPYDRKAYLLALSHNKNLA